MTLLDSLLNQVRSGATLNGAWNGVQPNSIIGNASASSFGTSPFSQPRGLPPLGNNGFPQLDDAQSVKFGPGQNASVDSQRREAAIAGQTPISRDLYADVLAGGGELKWDPTHFQWYRAGAVIRDVTPQQRQPILDWMNQRQTQAVGTPALNQLLANRGTAPAQNRFRFSLG